MRLVTFVPPDGKPRAGVLLDEIVVDLAAAAPLVFEEINALHWDMLNLLQGGETSGESSSLDVATEIVAAVVELIGGDPGSEQAAQTGLQGNGHHDHGTTGNVLIGGVEMLLPLDQVRLLAPLPRPSSLRLFDAFTPTSFPFFSFGNHNAIYGPDDTIPLPRYGGDGLYHALEIGCIIGRTGRDIAADEAADYIAGYTIVNNWQAYDPDSEALQPGKLNAKAIDFATSLGPWLVTPDELEIYTEDDGHLSLAMVVRINNIDQEPGNMILAQHTFAAMIAYASRDVTLYPGDLLCSGKADSSNSTPLESGDIVELAVTGLGTLRNRIG